METIFNERKMLYYIFFNIMMSLSNNKNYFLQLNLDHRLNTQQERDHYLYKARFRLSNEQTNANELASINANGAVNSTQ